MIKFETLNGWDFFGCCIAVSGFPYQRVLRKKLNFIYFSDGIFSLSFLFASLVLSFLSSTIENHYYVCLKKRNSLVYVFTIVIALFVQSIKLPPVFLLYIASFSNLFSFFFSLFILLSLRLLSTFTNFMKKNCFNLFEHSFEIALQPTNKLNFRDWHARVRKKEIPNCLGGTLLSSFRKNTCIFIGNEMWDA